MPRKLTLLALLVLVSYRAHADTINFDSTGSASDFAVYGDGSISAVTPSTGLSGSNAVYNETYNGYQYWIYKTGSSFTTGGSWTVSTYFKFNANTLTMGFSTTSGTASEIVYSSGISMPNSTLAVDYSGQTASPSQASYISDASGTMDSNSWDTSSSANMGNTLPIVGVNDGDWVYMSVTLNRTGDNDYTLTYTTKASDADGVLGSVLGTGEFSFTSTSLTGDNIYGFVQIGDSDIAFDNFSFASSVPEPSTYALFGGLGAFGLVFATRRRQAAKRA